MTNVIFVTQLVDPEDPVLGSTVKLVRALVERAERVIVVANEVRAVPADLGVEVISLGKERGRSRLSRGLQYEAALLRIVRHAPRSVLLAHMCPSYLTLAAPIARLSRLGLVLWFSHPSDSATLGRADRLADVVITPFVDCYPRPSMKVRAIGHAVDTRGFSSLPSRCGGGRHQFLAIGRTSPVKNYGTMISAFAQAKAAGVDARLTIVGPSTNQAERQHRCELLAMIDQMNVGDTVELDDAVPHSHVPKLLADASALISATAGTTADKVIFEAMAMGKPVLMSSPAFGNLVADASISLAFTEGDSAELARRIEAVVEAPPQVLTDVGRLLRRRIEEEHSLDHWAECVLSLAEDLTRRPRTTAAAGVSGSGRQRPKQ